LTEAIKGNPTNPSVEKDNWFLSVNIKGKRPRGDVLDILVEQRRHQKADEIVSQATKKGCDMFRM
jgi:hypothetical protein